MWPSPDEHTGVTVVFKVQARFLGGTDESPELCPQSLLPWRWFCLGLVERKKTRAGRDVFSPHLQACSCRPVAVGWVQDCLLEAEGWEEEMEVRNHTGCLLKLQRFSPSRELICHFSQGISPAGCKSVGSLLEKGSRSMLLPQIEVLGKVLLLPLAAASSTPTEFYVNRNNRFPPLVPNWPHVGVFSSLLLHIMKSQESQ